MVFARMPVEKAARLRAGGAQFHDWLPPKDGKVVARLATAFATPEEDVTKLIALGEELRFWPSNVKVPDLRVEPLLPRIQS